MKCETCNGVGRVVKLGPNHGYRPVPAVGDVPWAVTCPDCGGDGLAHDFDATISDRMDKEK